MSAQPQNLACAQGDAEHCSPRTSKGPQRTCTICQAQARRSVYTSVTVQHNHCTCTAELVKGQTCTTTPGCCRWQPHNSPPGTLYRPAAPSHPAQAPEHTQQLPALQDSCPGHTCAAPDAQHLHTTRPRCRELAPPLHKQRHRHCLKQRRLLVKPPACAPTLALLCHNTQHCYTVTVSRALLVTLRGVLPPHQPRCITGHHVPGPSRQSSSCLQLPRGLLQIELHQGLHPLTCRPAGLHGTAMHAGRY